MTELSPGLMALLDKATDPMPETAAEALRAVRALHERVLQLASATGGLIDLEFDADEAVSAVEALAELIEEKNR